MTLDQLHRNLLLGEPGRLYSELAASWLWVVALGGLVLWVARWRARRVRRAADLVLPERGVRGRRRLLGRHGALGVDRHRGEAQLGWLAPLFGLSLLAFLLVDAWRGYRAARRGSAAG